MKHFKKMIVIFMIISLGFMTIGCNTMKGMGKDVETAGEKIQEQAD